jgi:arylsulfatase A-like enzyme
MQFELDYSMKRRSFLKKLGFAAAGAASPAVFPGFLRAGRAATGTQNPNILVIIVDQLRFPQGAFNQELLDAAAPNIAALRRESVSFDAHFAAATMCSPSRATMLTGLYTHQTGMFLTNIHGSARQLPRPSLNPGFPTWGRILSSPQFGYKTFWWGKWHLSHNDQTSFDYVSRYGFSGGLPRPSPNGAPGQGLEVDPQITQIFKHFA